MDAMTVTLETSPTTAALDEALAKAQGEIQTASKDKNNPAFRSKYADLTSVWEACRPALSKNGIALTQWPLATADSRLHIITRIAHKGEWMQARFCLPVDKANAHGFGSAITYAKRFTLSAALGVVADDDDDGNKASERAPANDPPGPRNSSAHGRDLASADPHLIDHNRTKGTLPASQKAAPTDKVAAAKKNAAEWVTDQVIKMNESELTIDALREIEEENRVKLDWMQGNMPEQFDKFYGAFSNALERATKREAA
jgi:hypothetical protein